MSEARSLNDLAELHAKWTTLARGHSYESRQLTRFERDIYRSCAADLFYILYPLRETEDR